MIAAEDRHRLERSNGSTPGCPVRPVEDLAAGVVLAAAAASAFIVRKRVDQLDLVAALKTRE